MNKWLVFTAVISLSSAGSMAYAEGDAAAGEAKAAACASCHGADGNSANPDWPKLAGQHPLYLVKQLQEFKSGVRSNPMMSPMAAPLSEQDMADLAAYFAAQDPQPGAADEAMVELGEDIYRGGIPATGVAACIGCHGPAGAGNPAAKFPALSWQHSNYTVNQLQAFKAGQRNNDAGKMMRNVAGPMTEQEMKAVASYIQGLH